MAASRFNWPALTPTMSTPELIRTLNVRMPQLTGMATGGGGGTITGGLSNGAAGSDVFTGDVGGVLQFRKLKAGANVSLNVLGGGELEIASTPPAGGTMYFANVFRSAVDLTGLDTIAGFLANSGHLAAGMQVSTGTAANRLFAKPLSGSADTADSIAAGLTYIITTLNQATGGGRGFNALDTSNMLTTGVLDAATIAGRRAQLLARQATGIVFLEDFEQLPSGWTIFTAGSIALQAGGGVTGGKALRVTGDDRRAFPYSITYDPSKLYRMRTRVKQVTNPGSGGKLVYVYLRCFDSADAYLSDALVCVNGTTYTAGGAYTDVTGWFKGEGGTLVQPAPDPLTPSSLPAGTRYIRPAYTIGAVAGNGVADLDYIAIDVFDEDEADRAYRILNTGGFLQAAAKESGGDAVNLMFAKALSAAVDTLESIPDGSSYGRTLLTALTSGTVDLAKAGVVNKVLANLARSGIDATTAATILQYLANTGHLSGSMQESGGKAVNLLLAKALAANPDTLDSVGDGATYGRALLTALTSGQIDLSKAGVVNKILANIARSGVDATTASTILGFLANSGHLASGMQESGGKGVNLLLAKALAANPDTLDSVADGASYGRALLTALTSGQIDLSKAGVVNKLAQYILRTGGGTDLQTIVGQLANSGHAASSMQESGGKALNLLLAKALAGNPDTLDSVGDGATYGRALLTALTSGQIDLSKAGVVNKLAQYILRTGGGTALDVILQYLANSGHLTSSMQESGGKAVNLLFAKALAGNPDTLDSVGDGASYGRALLTALTSGQIDLSKAGVIGKTLDYIADSTTFWRHVAYSGANNLVSNGNFEASSSLFGGVPPGWGGLVNATASYDAATQFSGVRSIVIAASAQYGGFASAPSFAVYPGEPFRIQAQLKAVAGITARVSVWFAGPSGYLGQITGQTTNAGWTAVSATGVAPAGATYGKIILDTSTIGGGTFSVDEVVATRVLVGDTEVRRSLADATFLSTIVNYLQNTGHLASGMQESGGKAVNLMFAKALAGNADTLDSVANGSTYARVLATALTSGAVDLGASGVIGNLAATRITAASLSAITAVLGTVTSGLIQNGTATRAIRLNNGTALPGTAVSYLDLDPSAGGMILRFGLSAGSSVLTLDDAGNLTVGGRLNPAHLSQTAAQSSQFLGEVLHAGPTTFGAAGVNVGVGARMEVREGGMRLMRTVGGADSLARWSAEDFSLTTGASTAQTDTTFGTATITSAALVAGYDWQASTGASAGVLDAIETQANLPVVNWRFAFDFTVKVTSPGYPSAGSISVRTPQRARVRLYVSTDTGANFTDYGILAVVDHDGSGAGTGGTTVTKGFTNVRTPVITLPAAPATNQVQFKLVPEGLPQIIQNTSTGLIYPSSGGTATIDGTTAALKVSWNKPVGTVLPRRMPAFWKESGQPQFYMEPLITAEYPADASMAQGEGFYAKSDLGLALHDGVRKAFLIPEIRKRLISGANAAIGPATASVANLDFAIGANETWEVEWILSMTLSTVAATYGVGITGPVALSGEFICEGANGAPQTGAAAARVSLNSIGTAMATGQMGNPVTAVSTPLRVTALVASASTAGTVSLQLTESAGTATVLINSRMTARRIA